MKVKGACELCGDEEDCLVCQMAESVETFERGQPSREQVEEVASRQRNIQSAYLQ